MTKEQNLLSVIESTLELKRADQDVVNEWFRTKYSPGITDEDVLREYDKQANIVNAEVKLLESLLNKS